MQKRVKVGFRSDGKSIKFYISNNASYFPTEIYNPSTNHVLIPHLNTITKKTKRIDRIRKIS